MRDERMELFRRGFKDGDELVYPAIHSEVFKTANGTSYLKEPGIVVVAQSVPYLEGIRKFLERFDEKLKFPEYLEDPVKIDPSLQLTKFAGQACYMSFGRNRTWNKDAEKYIANIINQGHGSVLQHPNVTALIYGCSRSFTHEVVRHAAGTGYSQESQRYVGGSVLRFVERPEFQQDEVLHNNFEKRIDRVAEEYENHTTHLLKLQGEGLEIVIAQAATDRRKKVRQASRAVLTNETEAVIVMTANLRAWRHIINMRASQHAEIEIRKAMFQTFLCLRELEPKTFADFKILDLPDGTHSVTTEYPKV